MSTPPSNNSPVPSSRPWRGYMIWLGFLLAVLVLLHLNRGELLGGRVKTFAYNELVQKLEDKRIKSMSILVRGENAEISGEWETAGEPAGTPGKYVSRATKTLVDELMKKAGPGVTVRTLEPSVLSEIMPYLFMVGLFFVFFYFFILRPMRGGGSGGILSFGKSRAVRFLRDKNTKTFDDVAGIDEAREEIREIVEFLRSPEKFQRLGGRLPKGILLIGGPGTGKTLLAKAIAGEADVPFFSISGSDFVEMYVGVGASRVRDLFAEAKANSPCIIFLDEIDAIGRRRATDMPGSGMETAQTLNAILVEMDGFTSGDNVIVLAATNRPDVLDPALLRPGRFDRRVYVDPPDSRGRAAILSVHAKGVKVDADVDFDKIARLTPTFSGADLENIVNEAALIAVMRGLESVNMACFEEARDKVRFGREKRSRQLDDDERRDTAFHEAGHAMLMRLVPHVIPLHKVTIIPRGRMMGATMQMPEKDEYTISRKRATGQIVVTLGGRAAEELFLDDITAGASQDLKQATQYARGMVCEWGMSEALGLPFLGRDDAGEEGMWNLRQPYSENTARRIDDEIRRILDEAYEEARRLLGEHEAEVRLLVDALLEFEVLGRDEVDELFESNSLEPIRARRERERREEKERNDKNAENNGESDAAKADADAEADKNADADSDAAADKSTQAGDSAPAPVPAAKDKTSVSATSDYGDLFGAPPPPSRPEADKKGDADAKKSSDE